MVITEYGIKYAVHLISSHFGNLVAKVCDKLLRRGPLTLQLLIRFTELTPLQVKNSLLILIQHNCVQAFILQDSGDTKYLALFDNILHRTRFPKFLEIVAHELDKDCEELLQGLLEHGRLTQEQLYERARSMRKSGDDLTVQDAVRKSLHKLLNTHFIECCPAAEPSVQYPTSQETPTPRRGARSSKIVKVPETIEQCVLEAAGAVAALRFSALASSEANIDAENSGDSSLNVNVGEKRKHDGGPELEVILLRANFEEFIRFLRHKACIENVRARLDNGAAIVLGAILKATRNAESKVKMESSAPLSLNTIFEEVMNSEVGRTMTLDRVRASLIQLGCPPSITDESYSVDLKKMIDLDQNDEVESIVLKRYGKEAYRVFRLLSTNDGRLFETDKVADMTFVEKKETPPILCKLMNDNYLQMEKVSAGYKVFLLWKVNKTSLWKHVLDEMFHAALNLSLRLQHELELAKEFAALPIEKCPEAQLKRFRNAKGYLVSSLMKLDDALMLFHDF